MNHRMLRAEADYDAPTPASPELRIVGSQSAAPLDRLARAVGDGLAARTVELAVTTPAGVCQRGSWSAGARVAGSVRTWKHAAGDQRVEIRVQVTGSADDRFTTLVAAAAAAVAESLDGPDRSAGIEALTKELARTIDRTVLIQDSRAQEYGGSPRCSSVRATPNETVVLPGEACHTWPLQEDGDQVGRLWLGRGRGLGARDLDLLGRVRAILGVVLAA
ncbi:hypothetical protein M6B22_06270 [Jatrophihabitans cynanchi]|uniref:Uncharacterized protein n=1 Tax=Jatrophihabitans cynanchi TaxID=2944128 RepID=A0ABY7K494_9ACTN|nr:hypothetical protein [Jatrophihabitans sp. SB3-54]WAX58367.1 hypothetical protein M6B22_06270 [Jatrophihabitans sp. SB3-54]